MRKEAIADYERVGGALILGAVLLLLTAVVTNRGDLTSATLILCGAGCFVTGLFILTFSPGEPFDRTLAALLPVQGQIEICTICADLGIHGNGTILPPVSEETLIHFIPVAEYRPPLKGGESVFAIDGEGGYGVLLTPAGAPLLSLLEEQYELVIPHDESALFMAIQEVLKVILEVGDTVAVTRSGESIVVTITGYRLIEGCRAIRTRSPKCCTTYPCPVCSLIGSLLSRGTGKAVTLDGADVTGQDLRLIYSFPSA